jgi:hypothetical protein
MAKETGGEYFHAQNQQRLFEIFEKLSIQLHDDGIDEDSLKKLANETGGKYYRARDVAELQLRFEEFAGDIQNSYTVTYRSLREKHDGTARGIDIIVERDGVAVSEVGKAEYQVHGVVVPEMKAMIYLVLLVMLCGLLALPLGVRRLYRAYGGK